MSEAKRNPGKLTPRQAADRIGRSQQFVLSLIHGNAITHERHMLPGHKRPRFFIRPADLDRWEAGTRRVAESESPKTRPDRRHAEYADVVEIIR